MLSTNSDTTLIFLNHTYFSTLFEVLLRLMPSNSTLQSLTGNKAAHTKHRKSMRAIQKYTV